MSDSSRMIAAVAQFLRHLATDWETGQLSDSQTRLVSEFYMKYQFQQGLAEEGVQEEVVPSQPDFLKFLALGWYIYTQLIPEAAGTPTEPNSELDPLDLENEDDEDSHSDTTSQP